MAFNPAQVAQIRGSLARFPDAWRCPVCGDTNPILNDEITHLDSTNPQPPATPERGPRTMPCVALVCRICGYTRLFNAYVLGLRNIVGPSVAEVQAEEAARALASGKIERPSRDGG
jgi:predicted nucleic-acid-binding Zn-ribbon protein